MKKISVKFSGKWVLSHRDDDVLPTKKVAEFVKNSGKATVDSTMLTEVVISFDESAVTGESLREMISGMLSDTYTDIADADTAFVGEEPVVEEEKPAAGEKKDGPEQKPEEPAPAKKPAFLRSSSSSAQQTQSTGSVTKEIAEKIGCDEFKKLTQEIALVAPQIKKNKTENIFLSQSYLFSINDGYGINDYTDLLVKLIKELGVVEISTRVVRLTVNRSKRDGDDPFEDVKTKLGGFGARENQMFCIDISDWMSMVNTINFKEFLLYLEEHGKGVIFVFRIPFVDKEVLANIHAAINDVLYVRDVSFPPFTKEQIDEYAVRELKKYGFEMSEDAWDAFRRRIAEEKSDGRFYGPKTIEKVTNELIYHKQVANASSGGEELVLGKEDSEKLVSVKADDGKSGYEMLKKLIGGEGMKRKIDEIVAQIEYAKINNITPLPCIHMKFVGNPGTGKTTVARIIGKIFKERGILRIGSFFEYGGRDLCGRYIGETAPKTSSICRDAYGSVLFIDEAYSLYRGDDDTRDYGREALDTLIAEMENHRTDLVVIMAGYTDDMEKLMKGNAGLASRMPYTIEFPNFTREELFLIFKSLINIKVPVEEAVIEAAKEYFYSIPDSVINAKEFSNGRFVRNLFERTWAKAAMRSQLDGEQGIKIIKDDFDKASNDKEFTLIMKKKTGRIGFTE